ncbi:hypothetical protein [Roseibium sp.]|uniref:hypothetical protein n=1 Tax=Roseibium sp. TaxID=1936156 RepID=UPI003B527E15
MGNHLHTDVYLRVAAATKSAVKAIGGAYSAGELLSIPRQNIERWYRRSENCDVRWIPLNRIVEVESEIASDGEVPPITRALADIYGFDLVRRPDAASGRSPICAVGSLMKQAGAACETITEAIADGEIDADEKQQCIADLQKVIHAASEALGSLAGAEAESD